MKINKERKLITSQVLPAVTNDFLFHFFLFMLVTAGKSISAPIKIRKRDRVRAVTFFQFRQLLIEKEKRNKKTLPKLN